MAKSYKPIFWGLFAGGGTLAAFVTPVMIFITGLAIPLGIFSDATLSYDRVLAFCQNPLGKLVIFVLIFLPLWHSAHRFRVTMHDIGLRWADGLISPVSYLYAAAGTLATIYFLLQI